MNQYMPRYSRYDGKVVNFLTSSFFGLGNFLPVCHYATAISCRFRSAGLQVSIFKYSCISFHSSCKYYTHRLGLLGKKRCFNRTVLMNDLLSHSLEVNTLLCNSNMQSDAVYDLYRSSVVLIANIVRKVIDLLVICSSLKPDL